MPCTQNPRSPRRPQKRQQKLREVGRSCAGRWQSWDLRPRKRPCLCGARALGSGIGRAAQRPGSWPGLEARQQERPVQRPDTSPPAPFTTRLADSLLPAHSSPTMQTMLWMVRVSDRRLLQREGPTPFSGTVRLDGPRVHQSQGLGLENMPPTPKLPHGRKP